MSKLVEQIQTAFALEQESPAPSVTTRDEIPQTFDAITTEWLTDTLCHGVENASVTSHQLGPIDDGSSNRRKIAVSYNESGTSAGLPTKLFCKATHDLANRMVLGISGGAYCEVTFYNEIRDGLDIEAPVGRFANLDNHSMNSIVILDDLSDDVTEFCDHHTIMTRARVESQIKLLANLHGGGYSNKEFQKTFSTYPTWPQYFNNTLAFGMKDGSEAGFRKAEHIMPKRLHNRADEIWDATMKSINRHKELPCTITHGDVHLKNWYVAGNGEMGLSDWQCANIGHWSRDVAYTIATALTVEDRRNWERDLLALYIDELAAAGGPKTSFDEAHLNYRQQLMTAMTWWTITLNPSPDIPDMQPLDVTEAFLGRIATSVDDNDTLDSFK